MKKLDKKINKKSSNLNPFSISVLVNEKKIIRKGKSIFDCLNKITINFTVKTKAVFTATRNKKSIQRVMKPFEFKRLFLSELNKRAFEKRMLTLMK